MAEIVDIDIADLLVDTKNARLKDEQPNQQAALLAIAKEEGKRLLKLASDIVEHGTDPISLPAVVPTSDQRKRYKVVEGNRRVTALKALETPAVVASAYSVAEQKKWVNLATRYAQNPLNSLQCVLFASEADMDYWVNLRHTGANEGIGLVEWGADEKDRYAARGGRRSPAGQIIDFVEKQGLLSEIAKTSEIGIFTNLERLISSPQVRERLGIDIVGKQVVMLYPTVEVAKSLTRVVEDLKNKDLKVKHIYHAADRIKYAMSLPADVLPNSGTRFEHPQLLGSTANSGSGPVKPKPTPRKRKLPGERTALIPSSCNLNIITPRISNIYVELLHLSADQFPNHCSVMMRVFVELGVDHYLVDKGLRTEPQLYAKLQTKLTEVGDHLMQNGKIGKQINDVVKKIANGQGVLATSVTEMHLYVHNHYVFPKATELKAAWDELQPFMEALWK